MVQKFMKIALMFFYLFQVMGSIRASCSAAVYSPASTHRGLGHREGTPRPSGHREGTPRPSRHRAGRGGACSEEDLCSTIGGLVANYRGPPAQLRETLGGTRHWEGSIFFHQINIFYPYLAALTDVRPCEKEQRHQGGSQDSEQRKIAKFDRIV